MTIDKKRYKRHRLQLKLIQMDLLNLHMNSRNNIKYNEYALNEHVDEWMDQ